MGHEYDEQRLSAIETTDKNVQIIACAGSGKTDIVSQRVAHILKSHPHIKPSNIVAFTYTEKAAEELRTRIYKKIKDQIGQVSGLAEMYIGTIHAFCLRILQEYIMEYQKYDVLDEVQTKIFIDKNYAAIGMKNLDMERYKETDIFMTLMTILRESEVEREKLTPKQTEALRLYDDVFLKHSRLDFTMIMEKAIHEISQNADLKAKLAKRIKFLIVDEYQDVNPIQEQLIRQIYELGANVCVVGDDDQTIYQWRGSDIRNILEFDKKYKVEAPIYLVDNYRCSSGIVDLARTVVEKNANRKSKEMRPSSKEVHEDGDVVYKEFINPDDEFQFIADRIKELQKAGLPLNEIAILIRIKRLGAPLIHTLEANGIAFTVEGVNELFLKHEVQASVGIFNYLCRAIDAEELLRLWMSIPGIKTREENIKKGIAYLQDKYADQYKFYNDYILQEIYLGFIDAIELKEHEEGDIGLELVLYNLGKFSQVINDFEVIYFKTPPERKLSDFCNFLKYTAEDYYPEGHLQNQYIKPPAVRIMTIHQAKGLQFTAVFVPGMSRNIFPHRRPGGKSVWHFLDKTIVKNAERYNSTNIEDERRLFYVAVTRARKFLFLTRAVYNERMNKEPSQFLAEARNSKNLFRYSTSFDYTKRIVSPEKKDDDPIILNFSVLKDYYACPHRFKISFLYGFMEPLFHLLGYGRSLHNIVMDMHKRWIDGEIIQPEQINGLIDRHFHLPYAGEKDTINMRKSAGRAISEYFDLFKGEAKDIIMSEQEIEIDLGNGVRVNGRMDLVKKKETSGEEKTYVVDFKTQTKPIADDVSEKQLKIYAIGYENLTGKNVDFIEIYNIDENKVMERQHVDKADLESVKKGIIDAASNIKKNMFEKKMSKDNCKDCYKCNLCLDAKKKSEYGIKPKK